MHHTAWTCTSRAFSRHSRRRRDFSRCGGDSKVRCCRRHSNGSKDGQWQRQVVCHRCSATLWRSVLMRVNLTAAVDT